MSLQLEARLHVVEAQPKDALTVGRLITEAAIWRIAQDGPNTWSCDKRKNIALAERAIAVDQAYLGIDVEKEPVIAMFVGEPSDDDRTIWDGYVVEDALYVHKLAAGALAHGHKYGPEMLDAASGLVARVGKSALRLDCPFNITRLTNYYKEQRFVSRGRARHCTNRCVTLTLFERPV